MSLFDFKNVEEAVPEEVNGLNAMALVIRPTAFGKKELLRSATRTTTKRIELEKYMASRDMRALPTAMQLSLPSAKTATKSPALKSVSRYPAGCVRPGHMMFAPWGRNR